MAYENLSKDELITELKSRDRIIQALHEDIEKFTDLNFNWAGNLGHWYWDVKNNVVTFNHKKVTTLGYTADEIPDNTGYEFFTNLLHPDDYPGVMQNMRDHMSGKTEVYEVEYRIKSKDGQWKHYYDRGKITKRDKDGKPLFLAGIVFDISTQKNLEENQRELISHLSEELKIKQRLFSTIFHDLRSPVSNIVSIGSLMKESLENNVAIDQRKLTGLIVDSSQKALNVTEEMVEFIRAEVNPADQMHETELHKVIQDCMAEIKENSDKKQIGMHNEVDENIRIYSSEPVIRIAVRNFLSNAVKFSYPGAKIRVFFRDNELNIADKGRGIPQQRMNSLFEGSEAKSLGTAGEKGSGIGLMLVKDLLDKINVGFALQSTPGQGTTVKMNFNPKQVRKIAEV